MTWYDPTFSYKKALTIAHGNVSGGSDLLNFPVLVSLTDANLKSVSNGGLVASSLGYDLLFTNGTETVALDYEVESYTASSGTLVCWVRVPVLSASVDTQIYLYFGKHTVTGFQATAANVWKNAYTAVYHLNELAGALLVADSGSQALTLVKTDTTHPAATSGEIAGGESFDGSTAKATSSSSVFAITGDKTVEAWVNAASFVHDGGGIDRRLVFQDIDGTNAYQLALVQTTNGFVWACNDGGGQHIVSSFNYSSSTWYHVVGTYTASTSTVTLYVNGSAKSDGTASGFGIASAGNFALGYRTDNTGYFPGSLDEVRISTVARTSGWIATEYANQSNPSAFLTVGSLLSYVLSFHEIMLAFNWLYNTLTADASLMSMIPDGASGVYRSLAPPPTTDNPVDTPYIIMAHQGGSDSVTAQGFRMLDDMTFQIKVVGPASNMAAIVNAASRLDALIGKPPNGGSVTGGQILACYREQPLQIDELVSGELWTTIGGLYRIIVQQSN